MEDITGFKREGYIITLDRKGDEGPIEIDISKATKGLMVKQGYWDQDGVHLELTNGETLNIDWNDIGKTYDNLYG